MTDLLVRAFDDDPGWQHAFPERRAEALAFVMPRLLSLRSGSGTIRLAEREGRVAGVIASGSSAVRFGIVDYLFQGLARMPLQFGWETTRRMLAADSEVGALRNIVQPHVHHLHVAQLAVHPDAQGTGVGTALMRAFLDEDVDPTHQHASLMTTKSDNVLWYERFGFQIAGQCGIRAEFTAWCMVREPR
ncbi:MAG: GNAT family N-acetyltransferase [Alphaproteobacteria bacterium]|nr:GNAT family N-acetyltransferase [Alphaproteobacteria bacterium]